MNPINALRLSASRQRRFAPALVAGTLVDNFATSGSASGWGTFNSNGSAVKPTTTVPYCLLTSGLAAGNNTTISHGGTGSGVSFGGMVAGTSWMEFDLEFPDGVETLNGNSGDKLQINLSSDGKSSKYLFTSLPFQRNFVGRVTITIPCVIGSGYWTQAGGEVFDTAGTPTVFNYWNIVYQKTIAGPAKRVILRGITIGGKSRPKIMMSYDLGYAGVRDYAAPLHATYGIPGTVNVTRSAINEGTITDPTYMSVSDLQTLHAAGWAMGVRNGAPHDSFPDFASLLAEMSAARQWNIQRGLTRGADHCIYPVGVMTPYSKAACQAAGFKSARSTFSSTPLIAPSIGATDMYNLVTCGLGGTDTFNTNGTGTPVKTIIDRCRDFGKTLIMYTHDIGPGDTVAAGGISRNDLNAILGYAKQQIDAGAMDALTQPDLYDSWYV